MKTNLKSLRAGENSQNRRSRHWLRQREKILSAAGRLFWQKGYLGTSITDIAKAANVNKASVYYYFENKAVLLFEVASRSLQELTESVMSVRELELSPGEKLRMLIVNHVKWQTSHLGLAGIGQVERRNLPPRLQREYVRSRDQYEAMFREVIEEGLVQKEFRPIDPKLAALFTLGFLNSIIQWFKPSGRLSADEIAIEACRFVFEGLRNQQVPKDRGKEKVEAGTEE